MIKKIVIYPDIKWIIHYAVNKIKMLPILCFKNHNTMMIYNSIDLVFNNNIVVIDDRSSVVERSNILNLYESEELHRISIVDYYDGEVKHFNRDEILSLYGINNNIEEIALNWLRMHLIRELNDENLFKETILINPITNMVVSDGDDSLEDILSNSIDFNQNIMAKDIYLYIKNEILDNDELYGLLYSMIEVLKKNIISIISSHKYTPVGVNINGINIECSIYDDIRVNYYMDLMSNRE